MSDRLLAQATIHVACAADEAYAPHCATMLNSLLVSQAAGSVQVHYLHAPQFSPAVRAQLQQLVEGQGGRIAFHAIDDAAVEGLPTIACIPSIMWYRVLMPDLLPELDRILYLDADTLVLDDLQPLWQTDLSQAYVAAVPNVFEPTLADHPRRLGLEDPRQYFNSGVLLFNLARMRADRCTQRILDYARGRQLPWPDQDALNLVLSMQSVRLHPRWNCMNSLFFYPHARRLFGAQAVREACRRPAVVHFEGGNGNLSKPWHYLNKHPYKRTYLQFRRRTPWPAFEPDGRSWPARLLRPLPTRVTIAVLKAGYQARALAARLSRRLGRR